MDGGGPEEIGASWGVSNPVGRGTYEPRGHRCHWQAAGLRLVSALRITFAVGIACLVLNSSSFVSAATVNGWLVLFLSSVYASAPFFGAINMLLPAVPFEIAFVYLCCAVAQSYPGTGVWAVLSGGLVFLAVLLASWGAFPTAYSATFFIGPFCFVIYTQGGGAAVFPNMVSSFGNSMAVIICCSIALGYASCFLFPVTAFFLAKKTLDSIASRLACLLNCISAGKSTWEIQCLCTEVRADLQRYRTFVRFAQYELFFCALSGYQSRYALMSHLVDICLELERERRVSPLSPQLCDAVQQQAIVLEKLLSTRESAALDTLRAPLLTFVDEGDSYIFLLVRAIQSNLLSYQDVPFVRVDFTFLWKCVQHLALGFAPVSNLHPTVRAYVQSVEFRQRVVNCFLGALAMTVAALFALVPEISKAFYDSLWPVIAVGALWSQDGTPSIKATLDRLMGVIIGGFSYYSVVAVAKIPLTNTAMLQGVLVSLVFLFSLLFGHRPALRTGCILIVVLAMYEVPMLGTANVPGVADWIFSRLLLNLIGALIVFVFQSVQWLLFRPWPLFSVHFVRMFDDVVSYFDGSLTLAHLNLRWESSHREGIRKALANMAQLPTCFLVPLPRHQLKKVLAAMDNLLQCLNVQTLIGKADQDVALCQAYMRYCRSLLVNNQAFFLDVSVSEHLEQPRPLVIACERLLNTLLDAGAAFDTKRRCKQLQKQ